MNNDANSIFKPKIDIIPTVVTFHDDVSKFSNQVNSVIDSFDKDIAQSAWEKYYNFYRNELESHLKFEENVLFPVLVVFGKEKDPVISSSAERNQYRDLHKKLLHDHHNIRKTASNVFKLYKTDKDHLLPESIEKIFHEMAALMNIFNPHAKCENHEIIPLLKENETFAFIAGKLFLSYPDPYKERYRGK